MQHSGDWLHAWDYCCHQYLIWAVMPGRRIAALLCEKCGGQYMVSGKTQYKLGGGVNAVAGVEEKKGVR